MVIHFSHLKVGRRRSKHLPTLAYYGKDCTLTLLQVVALKKILLLTNFHFYLEPMFFYF